MVVEEIAWNNLIGLEIQMAVDVTRLDQLLCHQMTQHGNVVGKTVPIVWAAVQIWFQQLADFVRQTTAEHIVVCSSKADC